MKNISLLVILFMLLISGCTGNTRPKVVTAGGTVTQNGKPLPLPAGAKPEDLPEERRNLMSPEVEIRNSDKSPIEIEIPEAGNNDLKIEIK
jgi:hypothetical protein